MKSEITKTNLEQKMSLKQKQAQVINMKYRIVRFRGAVLYRADDGWEPLSSDEFARMCYTELGAGIRQTQIKDLQHLFFTFSDDLTRYAHYIAMPDGRVWDMDKLRFTTEVSPEDCVYTTTVSPTNGKSHRKWLEEVTLGDKDLADDIVKGLAPVFMHKKPFGVFWFLGNGANGKSELADSTPMLTPAGWTTHGELKVGDTVFAIDGTPTKIIKTVPKGVEQLYKLTTQDGRSLFCGINHYWTVMMSGSKTAQVKQTSELINDLYYGKDNRKKWYIPPAQPIQMTPLPQSIDPYELGCIIGDAYINEKCNVAITNNDWDIMSMFPNAKKCSREDRGKYIARFTDHRLNDIGLSGKHSYEKFIPYQYQYGSIEQRKSLLAGLLDTDGYINEKINQIEFSTSSETLAEQVVQLVFSLGGTATISSRIGQYNKKPTRTNWRIIIRTPFNPFKLNRKAISWKPQRKTGRTAIVSIELAHKEGAQCIAVEHPSHTYLAGKDFLPTHNTTLKALYAIFGSEAPYSHNRWFSQLTVKQIEDERDTPMINGKLGNICLESNDGHIKDTGGYKNIAEHSVFNVHKFNSQDGVVVDGNIHTIFNANNIPTFADKTQGVRRRTFTIPFKASFPQDSMFDEKLFNTPNFLSDFLGEMLDMSVKLAKNNLKYDFSGQTELAKRDYDEEVNSAETYFAELVEHEIYGFDNFKNLTDDYHDWCDERSLTALGKKSIAQAAKMAGFDRKQKRVEGKIISRYMFEGTDIEDVSRLPKRWGLYQLSNSEIELIEAAESVDNNYSELVSLL